jgi:hypothetical protein
VTNDNNDLAIELRNDLKAHKVIKGSTGMDVMRLYLLICAGVLALTLPAVAVADDPHDLSMRNPAARARDREGTRQLNLQELAAVRKRDAGYRQSWRPEPGGEPTEYTARFHDHERAMGDYARDRAQYEREMARWRRAVAACRAGDYSACGG